MILKSTDLERHTVGIQIKSGQVKILQKNAFSDTDGSVTLSYGRGGLVEKQFPIFFLDSATFSASK